MRIGIDARLRAYRGGGIAEHVTRLIEGLAGVDGDDDIVVLDHRRAPPTTVGDVAESGAPAFERHRLFTPPHHRLEGWSLPIEVLPLGLDLLHSPDVAPPRAWRGASVATVHDVAFLRHPEFLTPDSLRYYTAGVARAARRADRIITVSDHTRRELLALTDADPGRVRVVYNAVHPRYAQPGDPAADRAVADRYGLRSRYILFVSTIEPRKNVETLLEAYRRLLDGARSVETGAGFDSNIGDRSEVGVDVESGIDHRRDDRLRREGDPGGTFDVDLALAGADGWHSDAVYARARELGLEGRAKFLGFVPNDDLAALYRRAAVVAHPAHDEGFGFTPAEAMAAGTPVVVSDAGSLPEVVGDAGLRVPPRDVAGWAAALRRVLGDAALAARLATAGRAQAARFTLDRQASETLAVYHEAAENRAAGRIGRRDRNPVRGR